MKDERSSGRWIGAYQVLVVDDHPIVRQGLMHLLANEPDMEVCGGAASADEAIEEVKTKHPDLVIIDISLKDSHGLDLIARVKELDHYVRMLVWSMYDEKVYAERALRAGAMGYVNKQAPTDEVIKAIRRVLAGEAYVSDGLTAFFMARQGKKQPPENYVAVLSNRELQVFELIGQGITTRQIARQLDVRPKTVEAHRENIKRKLHLNNSAELTRSAVLWFMEGGTPGNRSST
jgi:DNA-binding NarL/FixJ family response regulator